MAPYYSTNQNAAYPIWTGQLQMTWPCKILNFQIYPQFCSYFTSRAPYSRVFNVLHYGAVGDGSTDSTNAFIKTWKATCTSSSSLTMYVPSGHTFLLHPLKLSGPCLSPNLTIKIDGNIVAPSEPSKWRCVAHRCNKWILIKDVNVGMELLMVGDTNGGMLKVSNITIDAPAKSPNTNGIQFTGSTDVSIDHCQNGTGDDCISIVDGCSNLKISNIICGPGHGISIGSLGKHGAYEKVENIVAVFGVDDENMGNLLCCVQVDQSTIAIKERFGKYQDVLEPGCHCVPWFLGSQLAGHLSLRVQQLDVRCETKTKDNVFVNVVASIQYRAIAHKANEAFYKLSNTKGQIQAYVFDVIRASVPKLNLDAVFEQKNEIAKAVEEELEKAMSAYGYEIVQTLIVDIVPDEHVKRAMNEINAAARLRVAANEKAEAEKILQIKRAEGEAEAKYLSGLGIARQRQAIVDGLRDSVLGFSVNVPGTTAKDVMDMVLVTQYFDTMKEIGASSKSSAVFIPHGPGAVKDVAQQIRDGLLQASVGH
ncbi:hypothetical protein HAX54_028113 [Datura stramonium]|nr:hypothetical protein [Datura stramonium]